MVLTSAIVRRLGRRRGGEIPQGVDNRIDIMGEVVVVVRRTEYPPDVEPRHIQSSNAHLETTPIGELYGATKIMIAKSLDDVAERRRGAEVATDSSDRLGEIGASRDDRQRQICKATHFGRSGGVPNQPDLLDDGRRNSILKQAGLPECRRVDGVAELPDLPECRRVDGVAELPDLPEPGRVQRILERAELSKPLEVIVAH